MKHIKSFYFVLAMFMILAGCSSDEGGTETANSNNQGSKTAEFTAKVSYLGEEFSFDLSGDELTDNVVFMNNQLYFKATNSQQQVLNIKLAAPDLYSNTSGVFDAVPNLPYQAEEPMAVITFYNPNERPLTNASTKFVIDDEVVVSKLTENSIVLAYEGDAITGAQLSNTEEGRFKFAVEISYSNFQIQDMRP